MWYVQVGNAVLEANTNHNVQPLVKMIEDAHYAFKVRSTYDGQLVARAVLHTCHTMSKATTHPSKGAHHAFRVASTSTNSWTYTFRTRMTCDTGVLRTVQLTATSIPQCCHETIDMLHTTLHWVLCDVHAILLVDSPPNTTYTTHVSDLLRRPLTQSVFHVTSFFYAG